MKTALLSLTVLAAACPAGIEEMPARQDASPTSLEAARRVAAANNAFGLDLYGELRATRGNLLISPHSIAVALAMAREGAEGETRAQMSLALHLAADAAAGEGHRDLDVLLEPGEVQEHDGRRKRDVPAYELASASRLWVDDGLQVERSFNERMGSIFGAPLETIDFGRPDRARGRINAWVAGQTAERIENIIPDGQPSAEALLALVNAVYFKARWAETFYEGATEEAPFHRGDTSAVDVPMMRQQHGFPYTESDDLQVLELPYRGGEASMVILLPKARGGLGAVEEALDAAALTGLLDALDRRLVAVSLPRFRFERAFELGPTLSGLGMRDAFSLASADFSGISKEQRLSIDAVVHKAFVAVDEEGTEAAAVTVVMAIGAAIDVEEPVSFVADHPFLFLIRHRATGAILFMGRVVDPSR